MKKHTVSLWAKACLALALFSTETLKSYALIPTCSAPPAGLAAWWPGESNGVDIVGGNTATLESSVGFAGGEVGQAFQLNSFGAYLSAPASASLNVGTNGGMTVECWINPTNVSGFHPMVEWRNPSGDLGVHFWLGAQPGDSGLLFANVIDSNGNSHGLYSAQNAVVANAFQHVALTYDRATGVGTLYLNGAVVAQDNLGIFVPQTSYKLWMGVRPFDFGGSSTYGSYLSGKLDELSLYKRALATNEIQSIYNAGTAGKCVPPPAPTCTAPPAGLVSWWRGESNALDVVGINNGILEGTIGFASGEVGQGFSFSNTNADVKIPASTSLNVGLGGGLTIETWINPTSATERQPVAEWNDASIGWGAHFWVSPEGNGQLYANIVDNGGGWHQINSASGTITANVFQHVAVTYDKSSGIATLYLNGAVVAQQTFGSFTPLTTFDFYLGRRVAGAPGDTATFGGRIDELSLYNRALSQGEIQSIYNASTAGKCAPPLPPPSTCAAPPTGLVSWWRGESNALDVVSGNNGSLQGGVIFAAGEVGRAFQLNSPSAYLDVPPSASLNVGTGNGFSIELWMNPNDVSVQHPLTEWGVGSQVESLGPFLWISVGLGGGQGGPGNLLANLVDTGNASHILYSTNGLIQTNVFQHVAMTYDKTTGNAVLYCNGAVVAQANLGIFTPKTTSNLLFGHRMVTGETFPGILDDISLYSRVLTPVEILSIYNASIAGKCFTPVPPTLVNPPSNKTVFVGQSAVFGVTVSGVQPFSYQWRSNSVVIPGATNATLVLNNVQLNQNGSLYSVIVANEGGVTNSGNALLTVNQPACLAPPAGLVSWWRGETNALDVVGVNPGALQGVVGFTTGQVGRAFLLTNSSAYVNVPPSASLNVGTNNGFTMELWINPRDVSVQHPLTEWGVGSQVESLGPFLWISVGLGGGQGGPGNLLANLVDTGNASHILYSTNGLIQTNVFQHVAMTYDKTTGNAVLYCNGAVVAQANLGIFTPKTTSNLLFGHRMVTGETFPGILDDISLYSRVLTPVEILSIYNASIAGKCVPPPLPTCSAPPAGLAAWWPGESNGVDIVGGNTATLESSVGFAGGEVGQAFQLNSFGAYLSAPASASLNVGTNGGMTVECWINPTNVSGFHPMVEWRNPSGDLGVHFWLGAQPGDSGLLFANVIDSNGNSHGLYSAQNAVVANAFQHVALTYDRATGVGTLYLNGAVVAQDNLGIFVPQTSYKLWMGVRPFDFGGSSTYGSYLSGKLDELSLYKRALATNEIQSIYNAGTAGKCVPPPAPTCTAPPAGLVSWWRGESNALDVVGINNGILEGTIGFASGEVGQGFSFSNTNADVKIPASTSLNLGISNGLTLEAWIYPSNTVTLRPLFEWNNGVGTWGVHFYVFQSGVLYANIVGNNGSWHQISSAAGVVNSNVFQHVALTYDKITGIARLLCNGVVVKQQTLGVFTPLTTYDLYLGRRPLGGVDPSQTFLGLIDEAAIYNRALSTNEIKAIYNAGTLGKCVPRLWCVPDAFTTPTNKPAVFSAAKLATNDVDLDGFALTVVGVSSNSTKGGTVALAAGQLTYTPPVNFTGQDLFRYTISDGHGGTALGTVTATVGNTAPVSLNITFGPVITGGNFVVRFAGIPGFTYTVEATSSMAGPWVKVANIICPTTDQGFGAGVFQFSEPVGANATRFYRTVYPAY